MLALLSSTLLNGGLRWIRLAGAVAIIAAVAYGLWALYQAGYKAGANEIKTKWDADRISRAAAEKNALLAYATKINQAQEQHDHDQARIDILADRARRLRIHLPAALHDEAGPRAGAHRAAGLFPAGVDQDFAAFQESTGRLIRRCDQLNIDAIRANAARATPQSR